MPVFARTIVLRDDASANSLWSTLRANWRAMAASGKPIAVELREHKAKRSGEQNKRYWALLAEIADNAWLEGRQYSKEAWHAYFAAQFIGSEEMPGGGMTAISTTTLNTEEFAAYSTRIEVYAAQELGIEFTL